jgi:hypothetical protein
MSDALVDLVVLVVLLESRVEEVPLASIQPVHLVEVETLVVENVLVADLAIHAGELSGHKGGLDWLLGEHLDPELIDLLISDCRLLHSLLVVGSRLLVCRGELDGSGIVEVLMRWHVLVFTLILGAALHGGCWLLMVVGFVAVNGVGR